jgi:hypothetical protein
MNDEYLRNKLEEERQQKIKKLELKLKKLIEEKKKYEFTDSERNEISLKNPVVITKDRNKNKRNIKRYDNYVDKQIKAGNLYREIEDLKRDIEYLKNKKIRIAGDLQKEKDIVGQKQTENLKIGDKVYDNANWLIGTVIRINKKTISVQFNSFKEALPKHRVEKVKGV